MATFELKENHILVGLGGTGGNILRAFKMRMFEEFPIKAERDKQPVALLYVDSKKSDLERTDMDVLGQDASFTKDETLYIKSYDVPELLNNINNYPGLKGVVDNVSLVRTAIGNLEEAAGQKRRAGRLLFAVNAQKYVNSLDNCFIKCRDKSREEKKFVHIFAGLCGGTGSGAIIDAIVQARKKWSDAKINVYAMIPEHDLPEGIDKGRYYPNGYAALLELNALQCGCFTPCDVLSSDAAPLDLYSDKIKGVANGIVLYSNVNSNGCSVDSFKELPKIVGDYIFSKIFLINDKDKECDAITRAFSFENIDDSAFEYDESVSQSLQQLPVRTKKLSSFGLKRVIYPEMRILQHMTYTVGQKILYQFKYNNWRPNLGYINENVDYDYEAEYLKEEVLNRWMLDEKHLTLEEEILTTKDGVKYDYFLKEWKSRVADLVDECNEYDNPLNELFRYMDEMYQEQFRDEGVLNYFSTKKRSLQTISSEIRKKIEHELFGKWRDGHISVYELSQIGELLSNYVSKNLRMKLDTSFADVKKKLQESDDSLSDIFIKWTDVGFFGKFVTKKKGEYYAKYQEKLAYNLEFRTRLVGLDFARLLSSELQREIGKMSDDISAFSKMLSDAIDEMNRLIAAQQKTNKGLEDKRGAVIEVSEEEQMVKYEEDICYDQKGMENMTRQLREAILPDIEFRSFGDLLTRINVKSIKNKFDIKLSEIIKAKHADLLPSSTKVLGLNILTQLQQQIGGKSKEIRKFAEDILRESGAYIKLDQNQIISHINNSDEPKEGTNINLREVLISIPSPEDYPGLKEFANELEQAFKEESENGSRQPKIFMNSPRKNELSIVTINSAIPMRTISWLADYKIKYEKYLHTGNTNKDLRRVLLHSEGLGENLPDLFAKSDAELRRIDEENAKKAAETSCPPTMNVPPVFNSGVVPPPIADPVLQMFLHVGGQQYGPYDYATLKQFVPTGQLTPQTMVWKQGMVSWTPAGQVPELQALFAPIPSAVPPVPPTSGSVPPPMNM